MAKAKVETQEEKKAPQTLYERLSTIDVSDMTQKKGKFNYLSWANAWEVLKKHCPDAVFQKHFFEYVPMNKDIPTYKLPYAMDKQGWAYVMVSVTIENQEVTEVFPVLANDGRTPLKTPNSMDVNTALQRCLTKCMGYHGLGLYIYRGEDLPPDSSIDDIPEPEEKPAVKKKTPAKEVVKQAEESKVVENIKENFPGAEIQQVTDLETKNIYNDKEELIFGFDDETLQFVVDEDHDAEMQKGLFSETIPHVLTTITDKEDLLKLWNSNQDLFKKLGEKTKEDWLQFDFIKAIGQPKRQLAE